MGSSEIESPIIGMISEWLTEMGDNLSVGTKDETQPLIIAVAASLGYHQPFDAEQAKINEMLLQRQAGKTACLIAWGYYHDYKTES